MRIFGYVVGGLLVVVGLLFLIGAFANAVGINLLSDGPTSKSVNGVLRIALAALPLVIGLVILSKLQKPKDTTTPAETSDVA